MRPTTILLGLLFVSDLAAQPAPPVWKLAEDLRIGSVDGPQAMTRIADITTSPDGAYLYVVESADRAVWMFDAASGKFIKKIGRGGDGPGEFRHPVKVGWRADTLYVTDGQMPRISLFSATGEFFRTVTFRSPVLPQTGFGLVPLGYTATGDIIGTPLLAAHHVRGGALDSISWYLLDPAGAILRAVGSKVLRGGGTTVSLPRATGGSRPISLSLPMTDRNFIGMEADGESLVLLNQPAGPDPVGRFQLVRVSLNGDTVYARTYRYTPRPVSRAMRNSIRASVTSMYAQGLHLEPGRVGEVIREHLTFPDFHPPFTVLRGWLIVTRDGAAWLRREDLGGATVNWLVVGPAGEIEGSVIAPKGMSILHVEAGKVWGVVSDEYDIPHVVRSRLIAQGAR